MARRSTAWLWLIVALAAWLSACSKESAHAPGTAAPMSAPRMAQSAGVPQAAADAAQAGTTRHIALRNFLVIEGAAAALESMHKGAVERCKFPACELLESSFIKGDAHQKPRASLRLRIKPDAVAGFVAQAIQGGDLVEQRSEAEDKTDKVIDSDARIANLIELRDRLRKLLKTEQAKLKDLIEVERELSRVQTELDSALGIRKTLANETERVAVFIELRARREFSDTGAFASLRDSLMQAGRTLAESLAALVTFSVAILPWAIAFWIAFALIRRGWRARKLAVRNQSKPAAQNQNKV
jgi:hypothetical protein